MVGTCCAVLVEVEVVARSWEGSMRRTYGLSSLRKAQTSPDLRPFDEEVGLLQQQPELRFIVWKTFEVVGGCGQTGESELGDAMQ